MYYYYYLEYKGVNGYLTFETVSHLAGLNTSNSDTQLTVCQITGWILLHFIR